MPLLTPSSQQPQTTATVRVAWAFLALAIVVSVSLVVISLIQRNTQNDLAVADTPNTGLSASDTAMISSISELHEQGSLFQQPSQTTIDYIRSKITADGFELIATPGVKSSKTNTTVSYGLRVVRGSTSQTAIRLETVNLPSGLQAVITPPILAPNEETAQLDIIISSTAALGVNDFSILAIADNANRQQETSLAVTSINLSPVKVVSVGPMEKSGLWQAQFSWTTDAETNEKIQYATDAFFTTHGETYEFTNTDHGLTNDHTIDVQFLRPDTFYHFRITSADEQSNVVMSNDAVLRTSQL